MKLQLIGFHLDYVRPAPKTVENTKIRIRNVSLYIIKSAENGAASVFEAVSLLINVEI